MNNINIAKTAFVAYRFLDKLCYSVDQIIKNRAVNSFYVSSKKPFENSVWEVSQNIIDLIDKKIGLINLKILVEKILHDLPSRFARLLIMRYIDGQKMDFILNRLQISERTFSRNTTQALKLSLMFMKSYGFEENNLFNLIKSDKWLLGVYNVLSARNLSQDYISSLSCDALVK